MLVTSSQSQEENNFNAFEYVLTELNSPRRERSCVDPYLKQKVKVKLVPVL